jgi:hypothetical protein
MNKNSPIFQKNTTSRLSTPIHPVWRGIGFILIILIPALGYGATVTILDLNAKNNWFPIPAEFMIYKWGLDPYLRVKVGMTLAISFVAYAIFLMLTYLLNSLFGPKRYIPPDLPPLKKKKRNDWFF